MSLPCELRVGPSDRKGTPFLRDEKVGPLYPLCRMTKGLRLAGTLQSRRIWGISVGSCKSFGSFSYSGSQFPRLQNEGGN